MSSGHHRRHTQHHRNGPAASPLSTSSHRANDSTLSRKRRRPSTLSASSSTTTSASPQRHHRHRHHRSSSSSRHRKHRGASSSSRHCTKSSWFYTRWNVSPVVWIVGGIAALTLFALLIYGLVYAFGGYTSASYTSASTIVIDDNGATASSFHTNTRVPMSSATPQPRVDRTTVTQTITALMDYYQRLDVTVSDMNPVSSHCYDRLVRDVRFKQMTAALIEMMRYDVCLSETPEEIVFKAKTWYGYSPKLAGVDLVEALYCDGCATSR